MKESPWFKRLEIALEFDAGFEIFLLLGRAEFARPALARIAAELQRFGEPQWHPLHLDGLDSLLTPPTGERVLHLVHGFERMPAALACDTAARLNLNRDALEVLAGPVLFWFAEDFYEELLRQAPDFVAWRSQASLVTDAELGISAEVYAEEFLLCQTQIEAAQTCGGLPKLDVALAQGRRPLLDWVREAKTRRLHYLVKDDSVRVATWCAAQLARERERGRHEWTPALLPALLPVLLDNPKLAAGVRLLWDAGALHLALTVPSRGSEWEASAAGAGDNRLFGLVYEHGPDAPSLAPLTDEQAWSIITYRFADSSWREFAPWAEVMTTALHVRDPRIRRIAVLERAIRSWRELGLSAVQRGLNHRGWREHNVPELDSFEGEVRELRRSCPPLTPPDEIFRRPRGDITPETLVVYGQRMHEAAVIDPSQREAALDLVRKAIDIFRRERSDPPRRELAEVLIWLAQKHGIGDDHELTAWEDAASVTRRLQPVDKGLLLVALDGLGCALSFTKDQARTEQTLEDAIAIGTTFNAAPTVLGRVFDTYAHLAHDQGHLEQALEMAERGLHLLANSDSREARILRSELWSVSDEWLSELGMTERALHAARQYIELRRSMSLSRSWPYELTYWAQRLFADGQLEEARGVMAEVIELLDNDEELPYGGHYYPLAVSAELHAARGDPGEALAAMGEAIRVYDSVLEDGGPAWYATEFAESLLSLHRELERLEHEGAVVPLLAAVDVLERRHDDQAPHYPADLANALRQLGEHRTRTNEPELAAGVYARILELAEPFPARDSEPLREIERRLDALCRESGIARDDVPAHYQRP